MNPKTKNTLINSMIGLALVLLIFSFVVGKNIISEKKDKGIREQQEDADFSFGSPSNQENMSDNPKKEEIPVEVKKLEDFFSEEDINASKETARQFSEKYYQFNGGDPLSHVENAKAYMTTALYIKLFQSPPRPTLSTFKKEVKTIDLYEPYDVSGQEIAWMSRINGTVYDQKGNITKEEVLEYRLRMTRENDKGYKVADVIITLINK
jgi:hypothetical protein